MLNRSGGVSGALLQSRSTLVFLILLTTALVACGPRPRPWGEIVLSPGQPIALGIAVDGNAPGSTSPQPGLAAAESPTRPTQTIAGHPIEFRPVPISCGAASPSGIMLHPEVFGELVGFIGPPCSRACVYAEGALYEARTTMVAPSCTASAVVQQGYPIVFRLAWDDSDQALVAADYVTATLHARRVAVLRDASVYGRTLGGTFSRAVRDKGGSVTTTEIATTGTIDPARLAQLAQSSRPEAIFMALDRTDAAGLYQALARAAPDVAVIGSDTVLASGDCLSQAPSDSATGCLAAAGDRPVLVTSGLARQSGRWVSEFPPPSGAVAPFAAQESDAVQLYLAALRKVARARRDGSLVIGRQALRDTLEHSKLTGLSGQIQFDPTGERLHDVGAAIYDLHGPQPRLLRSLER